MWSGLVEEGGVTGGGQNEWRGIESIRGMLVPRVLVDRTSAVFLEAFENVLRFLAATVQPYRLTFPGPRSDFLDSRPRHMRAGIEHKEV